MPSIIKTQHFDSTANAYTFCSKCGVDVTIYSHEDDCPCVRHHTTTTATLVKN